MSRVRAVSGAPDTFVASAALAAGAFAASLVTACGAPAAPPAYAARGVDAGVLAAPPSSDPLAADGSPLASLDAIAARGPTDAPLMREVLRVDRAAPRSPDVKADRDLCVRALFASAVTVRASLVDQRGAPRGDAAIGAVGAVPPRGPACIKKGEAVHLVVESVPARGDAMARAVIFAAP